MIVVQIDRENDYLKVLWQIADKKEEKHVIGPFEAPIVEGATHIWSKNEATVDAYVANGAAKYELEDNDNSVRGKKPVPQDGAKAKKSGKG